MIFILFFLTLQHFVYSEDICSSVYCGSGTCIETESPTLPYYCQCQNGSNTILPCPSADPCSQNPCGSGTCEVVPNLLYGYVCRCADDTVSLTSCNVTHSSCASSPCINGVCIEGLTSFICSCLPSWTGRLCDTTLDLTCSDNLCDTGKCFQINDPLFPYVCLCEDGEFARSCQKTTTYLTTTPSIITTMNSMSDMCSPLNQDDCLNGGECLPTINGYQCLCMTGFSGNFCEIKTSACASYPCLNGGICYDLQSSYICGCTDGSFRSQCLPTTADNSCQDVQCYNGGTCQENSTDPSKSSLCLCKNGYTGQFCEIEYFRCRSNGRFTDQYNCANGKYFECVHYEDGVNPDGRLLSRNCPASLRFNAIMDRCDYPKNVKC
ncbi:unnamed protein product [Adineta steineri]|uniref:Uncharacterized protein n=1 Tax=Adineta steineri TaxID=433720 RepID=A0A815NBB0_9BILA|nr:unnamed protein product [Adineta steineri]